MNKRKATLASAGILGLLLPALLSQPALAGPPSQSIPETSTSDVVVLDDSAEDLQNVGDSAFYPLPEGYEDAHVISSEVAQELGVESIGLLSAKEAIELTKSVASTTAEDDAARAEMAFTSSTVSPAAASAWTDFYTPPGGSWGSWYQRKTAVITTGDTGKTYSWQMNPGSNSQSCGQGIGYYRGYNGGSFGVWSKVYGMGCGSSGSKAVPWDNTTAYPRFQAKASYTLTGGFGKFI